MTGTTARETRDPSPPPLLALLVGVALVATGCGGLQAIARPEGRGELSAPAEEDGSPLDPATVPAEADSSSVPTAEPLPTDTPTPNPTSTPTPAGQSASPLATKLPTAPVEGALAPDLSLSDLKGNQVRLSALRGQVVLLNFWATW